MNYFKNNYNKLSYPLATDSHKGLYNAQVGAIHAIASYFTVNKEPALITMPTGSGKTAVLMMSPYLLKADRVLILTPSRMVRNQIFEDFKNLKTLKDINVFKNKPSNPKICEVKTKIDSKEKWEDLKKYDVVIGTPNCLSPSFRNIPNPPEELFDLILVDEAHHSPAKTWESLMDIFSDSKYILFTATPFRRDKKEIKGRFVYTYPLLKAYEDKIFGKIKFITATESAEGNDIAIAKKAEEIFNSDKSHNLKHNLMIRTDTRKRADQLFDIYQKNTKLKLKLVHSGQSYGDAKKVIELLKNNELDGIICVNMLGEGFNFPNLKIAAIHSPHKSLEVTLQFIGRFARTNAKDVGEAKFIAVPSEIKIEGEKLFEKEAIWQDIVIGLSNLKTKKEEETRETLEKFNNPSVSNSDLDDLSLYSLNPRKHVKIYRTSGDFNINNNINFKKPFEVFYKNVANEVSAIIIITGEISKPKWSKIDKMLDIKYDLFIIYYNSRSNLLFINSSRSIDGLYDLISNSLDPNAKGLPTNHVHRVLRDLNDAKFFNIGMRNMRQNNNTESYKIIAGSFAQGAVKRTDGLLYRQGHAFCTAKEKDEKINIGFSSASKVWSSTSSQIPDLIKWCDSISSKIESDVDTKTNSELDYLDVGRIITEIPNNIISADWGEDAYDFEEPTQIIYKDKDGVEKECHISELDIIIDYKKSNNKKILMTLKGEGIDIPLEFTIKDFFKTKKSHINIRKGSHNMCIVDYLNENQISFYTDDFSSLKGNELFKSNIDNLVFNKDQIIEKNWKEEGVVITNECDRGSSGGKDSSIHGFLEKFLELDKENSIIFYDHGVGELADFLVIKDGKDIVIKFFHCKGSKDTKAGRRVEDIYEVCGQVQKSLVWNDKFKLFKKIKMRGNSKFIKGSKDEAEKILKNEQYKRIIFEAIIVQPGLSKSLVSENILHVLAATNDLIVNAGWERLNLFTSK